MFPIITASYGYGAKMGSLGSEFLVVVVCWIMEHFLTRSLGNSTTTFRSAPIVWLLWRLYVDSYGAVYQALPRQVSAYSCCCCSYEVIKRFLGSLKATLIICRQLGESIIGCEYIWLWRKKALPRQLYVLSNTLLLYTNQLHCGILNRRFKVSCDGCFLSEVLLMTLYLSIR